MISKKYFKENIKYKIVGNKYIFRELEFVDTEDSLDLIKGKLKKFSRVYYWLIKFLSPVFESGEQERFISRYIDAGADHMILNVGSGNSKVTDNICNVDIFSYPNVDVVCDIEDLPFIDNSVDIVFNSAVLEHVPNPQKVVDEIYRVLKTDGIVYSAFPFMQGYHASPYDFTRVTEEGIKILS